MKRTKPNPQTAPSLPTQRILREIARIPLEALPAGPARTALVSLVQAGVECDVYPKYAYGRWQHIVWLRPAEAWQEGRHTLAEWMDDWAALSSEALARQTGKRGVA